MQEVGIKALKDNLSQYIGLVKKGEIVIVKDRNEIVAEIRKPDKTNSENPYIREAILKGTIIPAKVEKTNIDQIVQDHSKYKLADIDAWQIYQSVKDK